MTTDTQSILCGSCRVPLEGPTDSQAQDLFVCPSCGTSDTRENVLAEVKAFLTEAAQHSMQKTMRQSFGRSKGIKFTSKPIPKKTHRFVTNHSV